MGINSKKSSDPIIACLSITRPARNTDVLKIQRRAQLYRETPKSVAIRERSRLRASQSSCLKSLLRATRAEIKLDTMFAFEITDTVHQCACARANEYVKDCYYSSQYKLGAQYPLADVSIIHVHVLKYGGVGIASQLGEEEKDEGDERDGAGRAEASTASFITNLFHPVVEMGHCSLHATKATTSQSPSHDWCFHFSGVHHHRDKKCKPSTPTCKTQSLVESAFQEIGSRWVVEPD
ncbi:hypothetical protein ALC57_17005 [Trachymyrmex cornetzi]|uniref:Uncharacterized protein n=1 Tax=Trachymyrmex cornetzi TaxID=471704 RepID=A0A195DD21_9HYME|nr:hypothetical protein ALC57_17005 [Trachymyrmex cornetzi]